MSNRVPDSVVDFFIEQAQADRAFIEKAKAALDQVAGKGTTARVLKVHDGKVKKLKAIKKLP